ncbi:MAG: tRNA preQ1(34) S-adenosylmethionine ribosyltransferase-isomerase QueA [Halanaerobiales bacterium]
MKVDEFDYDLPEDLIAQKPSEKRDESRLLCLNKKNGEITHTIFKKIINFLNPGDLLILNNSKVIPARLFGKKVPTGTEIEILLLNNINNNKWEVLVKPGRRVKKDTKISIGEGKLIGKVKDYTDFGGRVIEFEYKGNFEEILDQLGEMPLPPYIKEKLENPDRYQTVYAEERGSAAAPTAGLHFTPELLKKIKGKGINTAYITLHVGLGTFRPVRDDKVEDHDMHEEYYKIEPGVADLINKTKKKGNRVIAVGTTVVRTLESAALEKNVIDSHKGWSDLFIYPGYEYKIIDALITNFHLPKSTLLMLVSAFAGKNKVFKAYKTAIEKKYRFYSLGDAMYIY